jgi:ATP-dependent RNA helicase RhlE
MPPEIRRLADQWLRNPETVSVAPQSTTAERIQQSVYFVDKKTKPDLLAHYVREQSATRTLVFTRTKHGADKLVKNLMRAGIRAAAIHGNKSQNARLHALAQFKSQHPPVLVATDIAARGLDIDGVSHVVNFDLPMSPELYVHRIGRTGRAGAEGIAVTFCDREERNMLRQIERITRQRLNVAQHALSPSTESIDNQSERRPNHNRFHQPAGHGSSGGRNESRPAFGNRRGGHSAKPASWRPKNKRFAKRGFRASAS